MARTARPLDGCPARGARFRGAGRRDIIAS